MALCYKEQGLLSSNLRGKMVEYSVPVAKFGGEFSHGKSSMKFDDIGSEVIQINQWVFIFCNISFWLRFHRQLSVLSKFDELARTGGRLPPVYTVLLQALE